MRFLESVLINRPPDEVWAFLTDFFNTPRVRPGALAIRRTSPGLLAHLYRREAGEWKVVHEHSDFQPPDHETPSPVIF